MLDELKAWFKKAELEIEIDNNIEQIEPVAYQLSQLLVPIAPQLEEQEINKLQLAIMEMINNAIEHGNLEIDSETKERLMDEDIDYFDFLEERCQELPYSERRIHITAQLYPQEARFIIKDEGKGFVASETITEPEDILEQASGRGILLVQSLGVDEAIYNDKGNQVTLIKRW